MNQAIIYYLIWFFTALALLAGLVWLFLHRRQIKVLVQEKQELQSKVNVVTDEILKALPLAVVTIDPKGNIIWHNQNFSKLLGSTKTFRGKISQVLPELRFKKDSEMAALIPGDLEVRERVYRPSLAVYKQNKESRRVIIFEELTGLLNIIQKNNEEKCAICFLQIDNYQEAMQALEEEQRPIVSAALDKELQEWANELEGVLKKYAEDRFIFVINQAAVRECQKTKFEVLDKIREIPTGNKTPLTLSLGVGMGEGALLDLAKLAQNAIELALGRGGDQVVVKTTDQVWFYGGKSPATEKRTRVRARVVAFNLKEMMLQARNVVIMGHENSDLDSIGSALGLAKAACVYGKPVKVVIDNQSGNIDKLLRAANEDPFYAQIWISAAEAVKYVDAHTLLIIVDTHKKELLIAPELISKTEQIVVIDHHRRADQYIKEAKLFYLEPATSSASELVSELLQYLGEEAELDSIAASALLAGIIVDTKNFTFQTGARTFEAATFLKRSGADSLLVRSLFKDDLEVVVKRAEIVSNAEIIQNGIAVATSHEFSQHNLLIAAQAADNLLTIDGVKASFVIIATPEGVSISARSNGDINVQVVMERLGGGGHLNVAGTQLKNITVDEAKEKLKAILQSDSEEGEE